MKKEYFKLLKTYPSLLNNEEAMLKIITEPKIINEWTKKYKKNLREKNLPIKWSDIGVILDDPYFIIIRDLVKFPNGELRGYSRLIPSASLKGGKGVVVLPEFEGKLLVMYQYRHPTRSWQFEIPRGYGEPFMLPEVNAKKEISEEIEGVVEEMFDLGVIFTNTGLESKEVSIFYAKLSQVGNANRNEGIETFYWLSIEEFENWIADGRISDGFSIAAYTRAKLKGLL